MTTAASFCLNLLLLAAVTFPSQGLLTVVSPLEYAGIVFQTNEYVYYGPQGLSYNLSASMLRGDPVCDHTLSIDENVVGKIVVVRRGGT